MTQSLCLPMHCPLPPLQEALAQIDALLDARMGEAAAQQAAGAGAQQPAAAAQQRK